jgi:glycerol-3-phosphate acyltransferase PlsX
MPVAVDAMGGDYPLTVQLEGAVNAVNDLGIEVVLVGDEPRITEALSQWNYDATKLKIAHCEEVVEMHEAPGLALRQKKNSSIRVAIDMHKRGEVDAVVSAGNTGAAMATAKFVLKTLPKVDRPAIATVMPSLRSKRPFVLLDVGANSDCKPEYLLQFALMGGAYAQTMLQVQNPRVALLNNGEEEGKGNHVMRETYNLMKRSTLNFYGNIEGKQMYRDEADVVVCDGFLGNITLKVAEGTFEFVKSALKQEIQAASWIAKLGYLLMREPFKALKDRADYTEIGGAPLLGVQGNVIICHGNSKPHSIRAAIRQAHECAKLKLNARLAAKIDENQTLFLAEQPPKLAATG